MTTKFAQYAPLSNGEVTDSISHNPEFQALCALTRVESLAMPYGYEPAAAPTPLRALPAQPVANPNEWGRRGLRFTARQIEVLQLLCEGMPNKLIARRLEISVTTVKAHISSILRVMNVTTRLQVVAAAHRLGLLVHYMPAGGKRQGSEAGGPRLVRLSGVGGNGAAQ